jgi:hypothetical protein
VNNGKPLPQVSPKSSVRTNGMYVCPVWSGVDPCLGDAPGGRITTPVMAGVSNVPQHTPCCWEALRALPANPRPATAWRRYSVLVPGDTGSGLGDQQGDRPALVRVGPSTTERVWVGRPARLRYSLLPSERRRPCSAGRSDPWPSGRGAPYTKSYRQLGAQEL